MPLPEDRYNILDTESRWQAAWRREETGLADRAEVARSDDRNVPLGLAQARSYIFWDVMVRSAAIKGELETLHIYRDVGWLGIVGKHVKIDLDLQQHAIDSCFTVNCSCFCSSPLLSIGSVHGQDSLEAQQAVSIYGADSLRLALLSDSPPWHALSWCDGRVEGAWRYCNRLWHLVIGALPHLTGPTQSPPTTTWSKEARALGGQIDRSMIAVAENFESRNIHKTIAILRRLSHVLANQSLTTSDDAWVMRFGLETLLHQFAPILPHLCEELWRRLGHLSSIFDSPRIKMGASPVDTDSVTIAVQVNGKHRGLMCLPRDADHDTVWNAAAALPAILKHTRGLTPRRVIVVPNRILNVVL